MGTLNKNKVHLRKLTAGSMVLKTVGFTAVMASTSIQFQADPVKQTVWASEARLNTKSAEVVVLPEKEFSIKVEPKPETPKPVVVAQRTVVARERVVTPTAVVPQGDVKTYAMRRADEMFGPGHWSALENLWARESGWNYLATNGSSGACGIPQANPCSKAGGDYRTNPYTQVEWGLKYIAGRYGTPSNAWNFWLSRHWY